MLQFFSILSSNKKLIHLFSLQKISPISLLFPKPELLQVGQQRLASHSLSFIIVLKDIASSHWFYTVQLTRGLIKYGNQRILTWLRQTEIGVTPSDNHGSTLRDHSWQAWGTLWDVKDRIQVGYVQVSTTVLHQKKLSFGFWINLDLKRNTLSFLKKTGKWNG